MRLLLNSPANFAKRAAMYACDGKCVHNYWFPIPKKIVHSDLFCPAMNIGI